MFQTADRIASSAITAEDEEEDVENDDLEADVDEKEDGEANVDKLSV